MMKAIWRRDEGFTLIELMVVVLIIGILVAIAIPVFGSARANARRRACAANLRTIDGAARTYQAEYGTLPREAAGVADGIAAVTLLVTSGYLKAFPDCPVESTKGDNNDYSFVTSESVECQIADCDATYP